MAEIPRFVVDASTILKALFQDESGSQEATDLIVDFVAGRIELIAPHQLLYETATVIKRNVNQNRMTAQYARETLIDFLALRIPCEHPEGLLTTAFDYTFLFGLSMYDSLYVALAQIRGSTLITGDDALLRALTGRFQFVLGLEDYAPTL